jgi:hypothetical protein
MDIHEIEERDLILLKELRAVYKKKEIPKKRKKAFWRSPGVWLPVLSFGVIVLGLIVFRQRSTTAVQKLPHQPITVVMKAPRVPVENIADESVAPIMPADAEQGVTATGMNDSPGFAAGEKTVAPKIAQVFPEVESTLPEKPTDEDSDPAGEENGQAVLFDKHELSVDVRINQLVTCGGVLDKQYVSAKSTFSLALDPIAMVWMKVLTETPPFTLKHVYFLNGKHYCDVPLEIRYPHMRTWSKVTINRDIHIGQWQVDVVNDNGEKIDQIEFTVEP